MNKPAVIELTAAQNDVYRSVRARQTAGKVTTRADVAKELGMKDKSWLCRILKALIEKGAIQRYEQRYYKLAEETTEA